MKETQQHNVMSSHVPALRAPWPKRVRAYARTVPLSSHGQACGRAGQATVRPQVAARTPQKAGIHSTIGHALVGSRSWHSRFALLYSAHRNR